MNYCSNENNGSTRAACRPLAPDQTMAQGQPQMELCFAAGAAWRTTEPGERRSRRAGWWFERMRQIVDRARDWQPALPPRPEQAWFPNARREASGAPRLVPEQRQICE